MRDWLEDAIDGPFGFLVFIAGILLLVGVLAVPIIGGSLWVDKVSCDQRAESRPSVPVEWHWSTGCIAVDPDQTVVVSS